MKSTRGRIRVEIAAAAVGLVAVVAIIVATLPSRAAAVGKPSGPGRVVLVAVDNLTLADIQAANDANFNELMKSCSVGLLNVRVHQAPTRAKAYITAGASARSGAPDEAVAFDADEPAEGGIAKEAYERRSGKQAPPGSVLALSLAELTVKNKKLYYSVIAGNLGDALAKAGKKAAVIGSSDVAASSWDEDRHRELVYLAMNSDGLVPMGDTGRGMLMDDPAAPFGLRTDEKALLDRFREYYLRADFIVIDFGDTVRADLYDVYSSPEASLKMKNTAIARAGKLIVEVKERLSSKDVLVVASLTPPGTGLSVSRGYEEQLTFILTSGPGFGPGYLTSDSTHRDGLVANLDIAPTVLKSLGISTPSSMFGRAMSAAPAPGGTADLDYLMAFNARAVGVNSARSTAIICYAVIIAISLFGTILAMLFRERFDLKRLSAPLRVATLSVIAFPLSSLVFTYYLGTAPVILLVGIVIAGALLMAAGAQLLGREDLRPAAVIATATLIFLAADMATGGRFSVDTIFGYDSIVGGRFYGMGNESYAVAVGAALIVCALLAKISKPLVRNLSVIALGAAVTLMIGLPPLGSNLGGVPTVVATIMIFLFAGARVKLRVLYVAFGALAVVAVVAAFIGVELLTGSTTHVGRTAELISSGGTRELWLFVQRRVIANFEIFTKSAWSYVLLVIVAVTAFLRYRPVGMLAKIIKDHPTLAMALTAALGGGIVGYLLEDSGIIVPAIMLAQIIPVVVYMMLLDGWRADG